MPGLHQLCRLDAEQLDVCRSVTQRLVAATQDCLIAMEVVGVRMPSQLAQNSDRNVQPAISAVSDDSDPRLRRQLGEDSPNWWQGTLQASKLWDHRVRAEITD